MFSRTGGGERSQAKNNRVSGRGGGECAGMADVELLVGEKHGAHPGRSQISSAYICELVESNSWRR